jgi:hypothetical protein
MNPHLAAGITALGSVVFLLWIAAGVMVGFAVATVALGFLIAIVGLVAIGFGLVVKGLRY